MIIILSFLSPVFFFYVFLFEYVLIIIFLLLSNLIDPVILFRISSIYDNFLQLFFVHFIFFIIGKILVLFLLPVLHNFIKIVSNVLLFRELSCLQNYIFRSSLNILPEELIDHCSRSGVRC